MPLYQGWNRQEMQRAGAVIDEESARDRNKRGRTITSFTPTNHNTGQPHFVSPLKTMISTALDSDTLYDLSDEGLSKVVLPKGRKRGLTQANKGRTVSFGSVWEYNECKDLKYGPQAAGIGDHIPKKRKVAPQNCSISIKAPSKTSSEFWGEGGNTRQIHPQHDEQRGSQLATRPGSGKRGKRRALSLTFKSKAEKKKPLKNPIITKASVAREKEFQDIVPSTRPISTHQGWTTTEDTVKLNSNGIAKTTLDKLPAFRCKSFADPVPPMISTNLAAESEVRLELDEGKELQPELQEIGHPSPGVCPFPRRKTPSELPHLKASEFQIDNGLKKTEEQNARLARFPADHDILRSDRQDMIFTDALCDVTSSSQPTPKAANRDMDEAQFQQDLRPNGRIEFNLSSQHYRQGPLESSAQTSAWPTELVHVADCFDPTVSEARGCLGLPDYTGGNQPDEKFPGRSKVETSAIQNDSLVYFRHRTGIEQPREPGLRSSFHLNRLDFGELPPQTKSPDHPCSKIRLLNSLIEVQVERSDADDVEVAARDVSKDYESDGFDEGLDGNDLLALVSEAVIPDTKFKVKSSERENPAVRSQTQTRHPVHATARDLSPSSNPGRLSPESSNQIPTIESRRTRTSPILSSEPYDEYPMDEGDEEIFKLPELMRTGVSEQFQGPESLLFAPGDEPGSGEVYDSSLQIPLSNNRYNGSSPKKVPSDLHTDKQSTGYSPARRSGTDFLPLGEGDEWNFHRSIHVVREAEVQVIHHPISDPRRQTITESLGKGKNLCFPQPQSGTIESDGAIVPTSEIQSDSGSIICILDDGHEYQPLLPFARPDFPILVCDRSPITGVSAQTFLRVCFRIGEVFKEGARCEVLKQDAVIELFARVIFSSREPGTTRQHFHFADLWHCRPPFPTGILANYKTTGLAESESKAFLDADERTMARCLGRLKRDSKSATGWMLHIINIRTTDWEEIKWTKRVVSAGLVKSETIALSKL